MADATHPSGPPRVSPEAGRVARALRGWTAESETYVAAAGRGSAMHRTDLTGLAHVMDRGDLGETTTPGQLSTALHLSAPATSAMLDRLERAGHVRRRPHPEDRRSVVVEMTEHARQVGTAMFTPLARRLGPVYGRRTPEELAIVADFLEEVNAAVRAARDDVSAAPAPGSTPPA